MCNTLAKLICQWYSISPVTVRCGAVGDACGTIGASFEEERLRGGDGCTIPARSVGEPTGDINSGMGGEVIDAGSVCGT